MKRLKYCMIPAICAATVFLLLRILFFVGYVPTESMEPTISKGSFILGIRIYGKLQKGDVIVFEKDHQILVKRIAAIAGEKVERCGDYIIVPEDSYYVLGDNAANSQDSRYWEDPFVKKEQIIARLSRIECSSHTEVAP